MLIICGVTSYGARFEMQIEVFRYVKFCPYDGMRFETEEKRQTFCCDSHRVMYYNKVTKTEKITAFR